MNTEQDLKPLVTAAFDQSWRDFAERHPRLADQLSAPRMLLNATQDLARDPAYRQAIDDALIASAAMDTISDLIATHVRRWFERLI